MPLHEIISLWKGIGVNSKGVWGVYNSLIEKFKNEFNILLDVEKEEMLGGGFDAGLVDLILLNRQGKIKVKPGYDGVYGEAVLESGEKQGKLF